MYKKEQLESSIIMVCSEDPEYIEILKQIIDWEKQEKRKFGIRTEEEKEELYWTWKDVNIHYSWLNKLSRKGIIEVRFHSNKGNRYGLVDRNFTAKILRDLSKKNFKEEKPPKSDKFKPPSEAQIDRLFDMIVGYEDIKELFKLSLTSDKQTHILMVGPPASAKTLFLLAIEKLGNAEFVIGGSTSKAGLFEQLFTTQPQYLLVDEIDKFDNSKDFAVLLSLMSDGRIKETKYNKTRELYLPTKVYASANRSNRIPAELKSRFFTKLHFKEYTNEEFITIGKRALEKLERCPKKLADYIVNKMAPVSHDIRELIGVARMVQGRKSPEKLVDRIIETSQNYREK